MNYSQRCRSNYDAEKWKYINQYYCRSWKSWVSRYVGVAAAEDRSKSRAFDIDNDYIMDLLRMQNYKCAVSGLELAHDKSLYSMSIDRIDNNVGHVVGNVQLISRGLNLAKNRGGNSDLFEFLDNLIDSRFIPCGISRDYISSCIRNHKRRDLNSGYDSDLDTDFILALLDVNDRCYFSGVRLACYKHPCFSISIDRVDNNVGHVRDNVRLVSKSINRAKRDYNDLDFGRWLNDVKLSYGVRHDKSSIN